MWVGRTCRSIRALTPIGTVVRGSIDRLPLDPVTRRELIDAGIRSLLLVGFHGEDVLIGVLSLAWDGEDVSLPSEALAQLAATTIARGLENARLAEEIVRRNDATRMRSSDRGRKVDELARAGASARSLEELVDRSSQLINHVLGASGTLYALVAPDGISYDPSSLVAVRPPVERWLRTHRTDPDPALLRWRAGEGAYLGALEPGSSLPASRGGARGGHFRLCRDADPRRGGRGRRRVHLFRLPAHRAPNRSRASLRRLARVHGARELPAAGTGDGGRR